MAIINENRHTITNDADTPASQTRLVNCFVSKSRKSVRYTIPMNITRRHVRTAAQTDRARSEAFFFSLHRKQLTRKQTRAHKHSDEHFRRQRRRRRRRRRQQHQQHSGGRTASKSWSPGNCIYPKVVRILAVCRTEQKCAQAQRNFHII